MLKFHLNQIEPMSIGKSYNNLRVGGGANVIPAMETVNFNLMI